MLNQIWVKKKLNKKQWLSSLGDLEYRQQLRLDRSLGSSSDSIYLTSSWFENRVRQVEHL